MAFTSTVYMLLLFLQFNIKTMILLSELILMVKTKLGIDLYSLYVG